ncbi:thiolase family protein [Bosea sp. (in: a-proteobacteria)]|uniref:thiolase family protein n=1 Tax=Bosea sp. (in: a-proteobacteria) TaxID=1871050 RepID=UPI00260490AD|nr:thiolase family protein [Bosea sp. (in: a-proteobacteria)]MCO5089568.1 thiolase family protein [Bosea sp. (in: a-proteobacteria)]
MTGATRSTASARVAVVGVGNTAFSRDPGNDVYDLALSAFHDAVADCGIDKNEIDGIVIHRSPDYQRFCELAGISPKLLGTYPAQGRMSGAAISTAVDAIVSGTARVVALVYSNVGRSAGQTYGGAGDTYGSGGAGQWFPYGMTSPGAMHAMLFRRHMEEYGTTQEQLAEVAMTFRRHASLNPGAVMREPYTLEDYLASRYICAPLRLLDYCLINDGAVVMIVAAADRAKDLSKPPVYIRGVAQATAFKGSTMPPEDYWYAPMQAAGSAAHAMAGTTQADIDALMIYDNFTPTVLFSLEGFGYAPRGESGRWVQEGHLRLGGRYPANTCGGHLSESYMQGWALNAEAVRQIRGECGARQVKDAGLVHFLSAAPITSTVIYGAEPR